MYNKSCLHFLRILVSSHAYLYSLFFILPLMKLCYLDHLLSQQKLQHSLRQLLRSVQLLYGKTQDSVWRNRLFLFWQGFCTLQLLIFDSWPQPQRVYTLKSWQHIYSSLDQHQKHAPEKNLFECHSHQLHFSALKGIQSEIFMRAQERYEWSLFSLCKPYFPFLHPKKNTHIRILL